MHFPYFLISILPLLSPSVARSTPQRRSYHSHAYYVLETVPSSTLSPESLADQLGTELVEQVGELKDHWLVRAPHEFVNAGSLSSEVGIRRDVGLVRRNCPASTSCERDAVMERYDHLRATSPPHSLEGRTLSEFHSSVLSLERQHIKQRTKRQWPMPDTLPHLPSSSRRASAPPPPAAPDPPPSLTLSSEIARRFRIHDPLWGKQWHLVNDEMQHNMVNVSGVWGDGVTGTGINVAIVDDGLDMDSRDLAGNFFAAGSWDYNDHGPLPKPRLSDDQHGTRCAGEVAAAKNDVCGVGVAHTAGIAGIRILSGGISDADEASALNYGYQENDIYSCSWGPPDSGRDMEAPSRLIKKAILNGVQNGRGGRGSIFVFASGNGGAVDDQCNFDGYTNSIYSVTVGAIDRKGLHPFYSEACSALMTVTYSSGSGDNIHTTDVGEDKCSDRHGGTSAAAPLGAGIFALVLQARPDLAWRDLQHLVVRTAIPVNTNDPDWQTTAAGRPFNHKYGYGKLDAWAIVEAAKQWEKVKPQAWWESDVHPVAGGVLTPEGVSSTIRVTAKHLSDNNFEKLEHITVKLNVQHQRRGNVEVVLTSPNAINSVLARSRRFDEDPYGFPDWTFMSVKHWGENPIGDWTLKVFDKQTNNKNGTFVDWSLNLWGSVVDASRAKPYKMENDDQLLLPPSPVVTTDLPQETGHTTQDAPTTATPAPQGGGGGQDTSKTRSIVRPTFHLPGNHSHAHPEPTESALDPIPTSEGDKAEESQAAPSNDSPSFFKRNSPWIYAVAGGTLVLAGALAAFLLIRRRRKSRNQDAYEPVAGDEDQLPMSSMENGRLARSTKLIYDAFGEEQSGSEDEMDGHDREEMTPLASQQRYRDEDDDG